jgi:hypothetical protein
MADPLLRERRVPLVLLHDRGSVSVFLDPSWRPPVLVCEQAGTVMLSSRRAAPAFGRFDSF